jgi:hypothetical protein
MVNLALERLNCATLYVSHVRHCIDRSILRCHVTRSHRLNLFTCILKDGKHLFNYTVVCTEHYLPCNFSLFLFELLKCGSDLCTFHCHPWVLNPGASSGSFLYPQVEPAQNRVQVQVLFFICGCT